MRDRDTARAAGLVAVLLGAAACGAGPGVEGIGRPWPMPGVGSPSGEDPVASPDERVRPHGGQVMPSVALAAVYVGDDKVDGVPSRDDFLSWVIASNGYWTRLAQYGVGFGTMAGSARVPSASFFTADELAAGFVTGDQLAGDIAYFATYAGGYENALIVFLPRSVGLLDAPGGPQASCTSIGGYHGTVNVGGTTLPYAVILPCANFPPDMATSHELVEMVTNPLGNAGWYDPKSNLEIGDICNFPVSQPIDLWSPSRFWSNADGACVPP
jgi:hypothetical protein